MRYCKLFILLFFICTVQSAIGLKPRYSAIVIDALSGRVLDEENADIICHPASLTKIATLYMIFEALRDGRLTMNTSIPVSAHAARQIPCKLGLRKGDRISVADVIKGMITKSANDASAAIAEYLAGSEANFARMMTQKAKSLGMHHTIFKNASGVPNPHQITTARDMAILSRALYLHFPKDYRHFSLQAFHHRGRTHRNHNHLLGKVAGVDGIKTGYVAASGFNLAASAVRTGPDHKPKRLIAVVLGGPNRHWRDRRISDLLEVNFKRVGLGSNQSFAKEIEQDDDNDEVDEGEEDKIINAFLKEDLSNARERRSVQPIQVNYTTSKHKPSEPEDDWGVQLGTYTSVKQARLKARQTLATFKTGEISTPQVRRGKQSLYGARLQGLTKEEAQMVCKRYGSKNNACRVLAGTED